MVGRLQGWCWGGCADLKVGWGWGGAGQTSRGVVWVGVQGNLTGCWWGGRLADLKGCIGVGVQGLLVLGTAGEAFSLTEVLGLQNERVSLEREFVPCQLKSRGFRAAGSPYFGRDPPPPLAA